MSAVQNMQTVRQDSEGVLSSHEVEESDVHATLDLILESQPFRTSKQCQNLLRYIVEHSLVGDEAGLRERILGIEVFGRSADYDTSEDPVVRMRAGDVRKRLAQFYQTSDQNASVIHIELKPGSYRAAFHRGSDEKGDPSVQAGSEAGGILLERTSPKVPQNLTPFIKREADNERPSRRVRTISVLAILLAAFLSVMGWRVWTANAMTPQRRFWQPLTQLNQPVLIYTGSNAVYIFKREYLLKYQQEHGLKENGPEFFIDLPKNGVIQADDLQPQKNTFVSVEDLAAATQVVSLMDRWKKPFIIRSAADVTMADLRNTPTVLIGGFNNPWGLKLTENLPFSMRNGTSIVDNAHPGRSWTIVTGQEGNLTEDYALISRLLHSDTGGPVIVLGGIGSFGTQAAAEFVLSPEKMGAMLRTSPAGWDGKNMQVILRIKVIGFQPVAVDVIATSYW